jgi:hypothetical protein
MSKLGSWLKKAAKNVGKVAKTALPLAAALVPGGLAVGLAVKGAAVASKIGSATNAVKNVLPPKISNAVGGGGGMFPDIAAQTAANGFTPNAYDIDPGIYQFANFGGGTMVGDKKLPTWLIPGAAIIAAIGVLFFIFKRK